MRVAETAIAALGQRECFTDLVEVVDQRFAILVENLGAERYLENDVFGIGARPGSIPVAPGSNSPVVWTARRWS